MLIAIGATVRGEERPGPPPLPRDTLVEELPLDPMPGLSSLRHPPPDDNLLTPQRVRLGRKLFFDPILSADGTVACASCHDPAHGFAAPQPRSVGIGGRTGTRNAPSLLNRAAGTSFFWDGRSKSLEEQALEPIDNPHEMGGSLHDALHRLQADAAYVEAFAEAYGDGVTPENLARALASFERVLVSGASRVDRFQSGDVSALSDGERIGLWLFESRAQCWRCHRGANYTDEQFHNTGVASLQDEPDAGRYNATRDEAHRGSFKTPGLRDVSRTAPYMHDGSIATLREVVEYYNRGGTNNSHLDPAIKPLSLSPTEVGHLVEFLQALEGEAWFLADGGR
ncbi:MAG TPA: cytochrome c peroxidase [Pirellulales bacterium]|nr:cytochrome c peroxidase [Pirellulales bacterium]